MEVVSLRTGPLVHRGAHVSRVVQGAPAVCRASSAPKTEPLGCASFISFPKPRPEPIIEASCLHQKCRLPINLREFLSQQLGSTLNCDSDTILSLAANADQPTLSKLARAIRRYSTTRAHQNWAECSVGLEQFAQEGKCCGGHPRAGLCLKCACLAFGESHAEHRGRICLVVDLGPACLAGATEDGERVEDAIADRLQRQVEEFRALRSAFGLPHYELDLYGSGRKVNFTWHPLS
jgi:hypothetical protein